MSYTQSDSSGDQVPLILESQFSTELHISEPGDDCCQSQSSPTPQPEESKPKGDEVDRLVVPQEVVLSTQSPAARKVGTQQLIPKSLAAGSRPKHRHHTTVVTFPVGLEKSNSGFRIRHSTQGPDLSWEDYDSDGDGFSLRRNRRNKSYREAVTSLDIEAMVKQKAAASTLKPLKEGRSTSPCPARSPGRKVHIQSTRGSIEHHIN